MSSKDRFEQLQASLRQSRWFDPQWMSFHPGEGTPKLGHFGIRSGPQFEAYTFYHELAHAMIAVLDDEAWRLDRYNFALQYTTKVEVFGREYIEPVTDNAIHLELRVIALQLWLMQMDQGQWSTDQMNEFLEFHVGSLVYMADFITMQSKLQRAGKVSREGSVKDQEKAVVRIMIGYCITYAEAFRQDRVEALWRLCCREALNLKRATMTATEDA